MKTLTTLVAAALTLAATPAFAGPVDGRTGHDTYQVASPRTVDLNIPLRVDIVDTYGAALNLDRQQARAIKRIQANAKADLFVLEAKKEDLEATLYRLQKRPGRNRWAIARAEQDLAEVKLAMRAERQTARAAILGQLNRHQERRLASLLNASGGQVAWKGGYDGKDYGRGKDFDKNRGNGRGKGRF